MKSLLYKIGLYFLFCFVFFYYKIKRNLSFKFLARIQTNWLASFIIFHIQTKFTNEIEKKLFFVFDFRSFFFFKEQKQLTIKSVC